MNQFVAQNLITGLPYRFKVVALNINGASPDSAISIIYACLMPSNVSTPTKVTTTTTSITIAWTQPNTNGCPLNGFEIYRDTGNNDNLSINVDPSNIQNRPSLRQYTINSLAPASNTFRFKIRAYNNAGYTDSKPLSVVLSAVPDTPLTGP